MREEQRGKKRQTVLSSNSGRHGSFAKERDVVDGEEEANGNAFRICFDAGEKTADGYV